MNCTPQVHLCDGHGRCPQGQLVMGSLQLRNHPHTMYLTLFAGGARATHLGRAVAVGESPLT